LDMHGILNRFRFSHHHVARYMECRFPKHDDLLLRTAAGVDGSVISTEEPALLVTYDCIRHAFGVRILSPVNALAHWGLPS
jgi:hypothetical protein